MAITTEVIRYSDDLRLLVIHAKPKNIGKVAVAPDKRGFLVTVRKIPPDLKPDTIDLGKLAVQTKVDIVKRYNDGYELEPGVEYDEVVVLIVPSGALYAVTAEFNVGDVDELDVTEISRVD